MAYQVQLIRIPAIAGNVSRCPGGGGGYILYKSGKADSGILAIIGNDHHITALGKGVTDKGIFLTASALPASAIRKHDHRMRASPLFGGDINIKLLPGDGIIGDGWPLSAAMCWRVPCLNTKAGC